MKVIIYCDGGSRGNPGVAGSGTVVYAADGKTTLREIVYVVGRQHTNNVAEYHGLLRGLEAAADLGASEVEIHMDSKLVVEQMNGRWKIKHPDMQKLAVIARKLLAGFDSYSIGWVPRAQNKVADALSNDAMDACAAGHPEGIVGGGPAEPADAAETDEPADAPAPEESGADPDSPAQTTASNMDWLGSRAGVVRMVLLRHGETERSKAKAYAGLGDVALTDKGRAQAKAAAKAVAARGIDAIVASPLARCQETAQALAEEIGAPVVTVEGLRELDFGAWEGKTFAEAHAQDPQLHEEWLADTAVAPPGGESLQALHRRVRKVRRELQAEYAGRTIAVVSHVNPIKSFVRQALDSGPLTFQHLFLDLASITEVEFWETGSLVRGVNDTGHLR